MSYHAKTKAALRAAPASLGVRLGRAAIRKGLSAAQVASEIGAARATVYNWFSGGKVSNAYRNSVERLLVALSTR